MRYKTKSETLSFVMIFSADFFGKFSYDLDMPAEVDDEYWEHPDPAMAFRQPPGKPSLISAFNTFIRLNVLLSMALRTIVRILWPFPLLS